MSNMSSTPAERRSDETSLDTADRRLIAALQTDARQPVVALARTINLSRSATHARIERLESLGIIAGYTVRLRNSLPEGIAAVISITFLPGFSCPMVMPKLEQMPQLMQARSLSGPIDLMLDVITEDMDALAKLRETIASIRGIASVITQPVLKIHLNRTAAPAKI